MSKILNFFLAQKNVSHYEKQKTIAFLFVISIGFIISLLYISHIILLQTNNFTVSFYSAISIDLVCVFCLFLLKKQDIKTSGNIFSVLVVAVALIFLNILSPNISAFYKFTQGFYTIFVFLCLGILFATKRVIILNTILILATTTRVYFYALKQLPSQEEFINLGYFTNSISIILTSTIIYFATKFSENALNKAQRDAEIKDHQNKELNQYRTNLEEMVLDKTKQLEINNKELKATNEEIINQYLKISEQNEIMNQILSKLKKTQIQLMQSEKMASLGILTAGIAHEINNPLNFIKGSYYGIKDYFDKNKSKNEEIDILLGNLKSGVDRAAGIIRSLRQFNQSSESLDEICNIHRIIENCLLILEYKYQKTIIINKTFTKNIKSINGNIGKLHQVFLNILNNAIQSIEETGEIEIHTEQQNTNLIIKITDTGKGISKEIIHKITDPFFTTKNPGKGIGLGLSISYNIIKEHKGEIEFLSKKNKGTTVTIQLPLYLK